MTQVHERSFITNTESEQSNIALKADIDNLQKEIHNLEIKNNALQSQVDYFTAHLLTSIDFLDVS